MNEIEAVEQVKPDPELIALTKRVMDQNDAILRMNGRLLDMLTSPILLVRGKDTANKVLSKEGVFGVGDVK